MYTYNLSIDIVSFNFVKCYNISVLFLKSITTMCVCVCVCGIHP
jgi:hypothetical protein